MVLYLIGAGPSIIGYNCSEDSSDELDEDIFFITVSFIGFMSRKLGLLV
jgi:hypothetical protein